MLISDLFDFFNLTRFDGEPAGGAGTATPPPADPPPDPPPTPPATPPAGDPPPADPPPADDPASWDKERAAATIKRQREAEREAVKRADAAEAKLKEKERSEMEEGERLKAEAEDARKAADAARREANEARLQVKIANLTVKIGEGEDAKDVGVADAELAADALLKQGVTFKDDGSVEDLEDRVRRLLTERPVLVKGESPPPAATPPATGTVNGGSGAAGGQAPPQLTADQVKAANEAGMTPEQYAALGSGKTTLEDWQKSRPKPPDE